MAWKPIAEYPTTAPEPGPIVLARDAERRPMLVLLNKGQFYICPGMPMYYGEKQFGCMIAGGLVEFMEIPD